jgi:two-component system, NtrC family, response regulator AtoC
MKGNLIPLTRFPDGDRRLGVLEPRAGSNARVGGVEAVDALRTDPAPLAAVIVSTSVVLDVQGQEAEGKLRREMDLWCSPKMRDIVAIIREVARVDVTVLVTGETGTGKDVVARAIHQLSTRRTAPFVKVNCAAVPRELLESELFGHERGSFTGAHALKVGKFEAADRGTIFLDEIGDLHPDLQAKLLHVLQDGEFSRVGARAARRVDVRVIAATNQDLETAASDGRFRNDLYYRLNVVQIGVPPLRERREEIRPLIDYFVELYSARFHRDGAMIADDVVDQLLQYRFPGNVRELENLVKRILVLGMPPLLPSAPGGRVAATPSMALDPPLFESSLRDIGRQAALAAERQAIARALQLTDGNRVRAAKALRVSYRSLLYKIKETRLRNGAEVGGHTT